MPPLSLDVAVWDYDRVRPLADGTVKAEGIELNVLYHPPEETFFRQWRYTEFDVSEMSMCQYAIALSRGDDRFIAIPVFLSRMFRHSCIFVNAHAGIERPEDLKGKRVGCPEWEMTALVAIRGMLKDEYGVAQEDMRWIAGRASNVRWKLEPPPGVSLEVASPDQDLDDMLERGEIDALFTARMPEPFRKGSPNVKRLFPNHREVEQAYYRKTKIFPIMHTVVIKREIYHRHPWVAQNLFKAFSAAKDIATRALYETAALKVALPWLVAEIEAEREVFGEDLWPYGIEPNRPSLESFLRWMWEQGLTTRRLELSEFFAPTTFGDFEAFMQSDRHFQR